MTMHEFLVIWAWVGIALNTTLMALDVLGWLAGAAPRTETRGWGVIAAFGQLSVCVLILLLLNGSFQ